MFGSFWKSVGLSKSKSIGITLCDAPGFLAFSKKIDSLGLNTAKKTGGHFFNGAWTNPLVLAFSVTTINIRVALKPRPTTATDAIAPKCSGHFGNQSA